MTIIGKEGMFRILKNARFVSGESVSIRGYARGAKIPIFHYKTYPVRVNMISPKRALSIITDLC